MDEHPYYRLLLHYHLLALLLLFDFYDVLPMEKDFDDMLNYECHLQRIEDWQRL
jgi:hypothetical protein